MLMRSGSTMSLSNRSKIPIPSDPSNHRTEKKKIDNRLLCEILKNVCWESETDREERERQYQGL